MVEHSSPMKALMTAHHADAIGRVYRGHKDVQDLVRAYLDLLVEYDYLKVVIAKRLPEANKPKPRTIHP